MRRSWLAQAKRSIRYARNALRREPLPAQVAADIVRWAIEDARLYRSWAREAGGGR